mgnify:CR=1 FL=1
MKLQFPYAQKPRNEGKKVTLEEEYNLYYIILYNLKNLKKINESSYARIEKMIKFYEDSENYERCAFLNNFLKQLK